jgi:uncharacterized protein YceH (UPF0502 family)
MELSAEEMRVLGSLVEKQLTTPAQYPLTLNALTLACNQTSSRYPIVSYDERTVEATVTSAKTRGLARFVHPSHGRSALRFAHTMDEALGLDSRQLALLAVLMLRGPQTLAELRTRTERMAAFADVGEVEAELDALARRDEPFAARLDRRPGQKEVRYTHLLGASASEPPASEPPASEPPAAPAPVAPAPVAPAPVAGPGVAVRDPAPGTPGGGAVHDPTRSVAALANQVAALQAEVASVRRDVDDLRAQLGV